MLILDLTSSEKPVECSFVLDFGTRQRTVEISRENIGPE
jgi:hypothetical protein